MSMTPPGVNMTLLQERYDDHLAKLQELAELEYEHNVTTVISAATRH